jgi:hypothetical protein
MLKNIINKYKIDMIIIPSIIATLASWHFRKKNVIMSKTIFL